MAMASSWGCAWSSVVYPLMASALSACPWRPPYGGARCPL
jgi:hypothetical protein